jgi:hypothetical protein
MAERTEMDVKVILSGVRALLSEVVPCLRSVSIEVNGKTIVWQCLFDSDATEDDFELLSAASTELIADFDDYDLKEIIKYVPYPEQMENLKNIIFLRHENNYWKD